MKYPIILSLLLVVFPAWLVDFSKDKLTVFASLSYYGSDFDGDKLSDLSVWDSKTNTLYFQLSSNKQFYQRRFIENQLSYQPVFADYDGDKKTDFAFFHRDSGHWIIYLTTDPDNPKKMFFGTVGDLPIPADIDGEGIFKHTIWRPVGNTWLLIAKDKDGSYAEKTVVEGNYQDSTFAGDYDGDKKSDLTVWRPDDGFWHIVKSSTEFDFSQSEHIQHGKEWDVIVPNDYDADGRCDLVFWRPETQTWHFLYAATRSQNQIKFGHKDDIPVSTDMDGDGIPELLTWNPLKKSWNVLNLRTKESSSNKWSVPNGCIPAVSILQTN